jgi:hypothetical protein
VVRTVGRTLAQRPEPPQGPAAAVALTGSRIEQAADSGDAPVDATRFAARVFSLDRTAIIANAGAGAVRLAGGHLGTLDCGGARLENSGGPALNADNLQVSQDVHLAGGFTATSAGDQAVLVLTGARIGGTFRLDTDGIGRTAPDRGPLIELDGLTYSGLPRPTSLRPWLTLLRTHTPGYAAQPYQHLAAGHDRDARSNTSSVGNRRSEERRSIDPRRTMAS